VSSREEVQAWKKERDRKYADGTWVDEIKAWSRAQKDKEAREDFSKYSWETWFNSLSLPELQSLANSWWKVIQYAEGHELLVMRWNQQRLWREILRRQRDHSVSVREAGVAP
jgi:hypothetical protein